MCALSGRTKLFMGVAVFAVCTQAKLVEEPLDMMVAKAKYIVVCTVVGVDTSRVAGQVALLRVDLGIKMLRKADTLKVNCEPATSIDAGFVVNEKCIVFVGSGGGVVQGSAGKIAIEDTVVCPWGIADEGKCQSVNLFVTKIRDILWRIGKKTSH